MAQLHDGTQVAVKVQYPGVAKSIDSDIRNDANKKINCPIARKGFTAPPPIFLLRATFEKGFKLTIQTPFFFFKRK